MKTTRSQAIQRLANLIIRRGVIGSIQEIEDTCSGLIACDSALDALVENVDLPGSGWNFENFIADARRLATKTRNERAAS